MAITLQELLVKVSADISEYSTGMDTVVSKSGAISSAMDKTAGSIDQTIVGLEKLGSSLSRVGSTMTAAITLPMVGVGVAALKMSSDLQQATIAFTTMLGSAQLAQKHLEELRDFAMKTPFQFNDLVDASKRLQALGFTAQQIIPTLTAVGDAAAALGSGKEGIDRITLALGQMQAKGKVSAEEMRQLAEAGIPAWQLLADAISKTEGKVVSVGDTMKMAEKGMIDGVTAVQVLLQGMEGKFGGLMEKQMVTIQGQFSNLGDQTQKVLVEVGDALTPLGHKALELGTTLVNGISGAVHEFKSLPPAAQEAAAALGGIVVAAGPVLLVLGKVVEAYASSMKALSSFGNMASLGVLGGGGTAGLVVGMGSAVVGAAIAFKQLADQTQGLHALDAAFKEFMANYKTDFMGPLQAGEKPSDRFKGKIEELTTAMNLGLVAENDYFRLMKEIRDKQKALETQDVSDALSGFKIPGLTVLKDKKPGGTPGLIRKPTEEPGKVLADAAGLLGLTDLQANMKAYEDAYAKAAASGKYTTEQLTAAWTKVQGAIDAATFAVQSFTKYADVKAFNMDSLPSLDAQVRTGAAALVAANSFKALKDSLQGAKEQMAAMIEEENRYRDNGFDPSKIKAGLLGNESVSAFQGDFTTIAQMQALKEAAMELDKQFANMSNPFGAMNADAAKFIDSLQDGVVAMSRIQLVADPLHKAFADLGLAFNDATGEMESKAVRAFDIIAQSADTSLVGVENAWAKVNSQVNNLAKTNLPEAIRLENEYVAALVKKGAAIGDIYAEQEKILALEIRIKTNRGESANAEVIQLTNLRAINDAMHEMATLGGDLYQSIGKDLSLAWDHLGKGFADAILNGENFGKVITGVFRELKKQILEDVVGTAFKALKDALITNTGLLGGLSRGLSGILGGGGGLVGTGAIPGGVAGGLDAALGGGTSAAGGVASAAGGVGSGAATAAGSLGSIANIANIANAGISLVSGVVSAIQNMHMEKTLGLIEESTRYLKIGLVTQGDSLLNDSHVIRNSLTDFFSAHLNFGVLVNLVKELTDTKGVTAEIRDYLYNPIGPLLQQMASGGSAFVSNPDGTVAIQPVAFDGIIKSIADGSKSIVDAITAAVKSIAALAGYTGGRGTFANQNSTIQTGLTGVEVVPGTTRTTGLGGGSSLTPPSRPEAPAVTQPYNNGIPYDTARTVVNIPADQNTVNTLLVLNQSVINGFTATIEQLKKMGAVGAAADAKKLPLTTAEQANQMIKEMADSGATQEEISAKLTSLGFTMQTTAAATQSVADALQSGPAVQLGAGATSPITPEAPLQPGQHYQLGPGATAAITPEAALQPGQHYQLGPSDPASLYTTFHMPMPTYSGSWEPATYVPGPGQFQTAGTTVNIINPTFRDQRDANAIIDLVRNSL